jgi:hypothetical protein
MTSDFAGALHYTLIPEEPPKPGSLHEKITSID